ncbi:MAG: hypothetical protein HFG58_08025 [Lachnospiraceae bacterium]|nr:hypothetical protein [Lachnospiraceae bacterium]
MEMIVYGYFLIATYLAWVFLTGRSEWLDQKNIVGICAKLFISIVLGCLFGLIFILLFIARIIFKKP